MNTEPTEATVLKLPTSLTFDHEVGKSRQRRAELIEEVAALIYTGFNRESWEDLEDHAGIRPAFRRVAESVINHIQERA